MGELSGDMERTTSIDTDHAVQQTEFDTDVPDVKANGVKMGLPVFNVDDKDFYQNFNFGRRRLRFAPGSNVQQYMAKTRYNKPFWIQHTKSGELRKVK
jgi:hypothetical protein